MIRTAPLVAINFPSGTAVTWPSEPPPTPQQVTDKLTYWREHLLEHGNTTSPLTRTEITTQLDRWLDERVNQRGQCWHQQRLTEYCRTG